VPFLLGRGRATDGRDRHRGRDHKATHHPPAV
jgi:hypothetical protein